MSLFLQQLHIIFTVLFRMVSLVLFATTRTNSDPLQVLSTMAPKQDRTYARGQSKFVALSACLIIGSDDERDPEYVPQALLHLPVLHVLLEPHPRRWRPV